VTQLDEQWVVAAYDRVADEFAAEGASVKILRDETIHRVSAAIEAGEYTLPTKTVENQVADIFDRVVPKARRVRRSELRTQFRIILDILEGGTLLGDEDPKLDQAFPLGNGEDKTLRYWTVVDVAMSINVRYEKAAEATSAATGFDADGTALIAELNRRGVRFIGDSLDCLTASD